MKAWYEVSNREAQLSLDKKDSEVREEELMSQRETNNRNRGE